ncbi:MAG: GNAT family N-acetyltransferase [Flavobacteriaceae bacterium]
MNINGALGKVIYEENKGHMYLTHSEIPYDLRGRGIGKVMVTKVFEKLTEEGYEATAICSFIKAVARRSTKWSKINH